MIGFHSLSAPFSILKKRGGKISFRRVGKDGNNRFPLAEKLSEAKRGGNVGAARNAAHNALKACEVL